MRPVVAALASPLSIARLPARTWPVFALYLGLCAIELGVIAALLVAYQDDARAWLIDFVFPESWHLVVDLLVDRYLRDQQRILLINAAVSGALMVVTTTLFPIKEWVSASFERRANLSGGRTIRELPLWEQGWEEVKLFLLFLAVQASIFWLDYHPGAGRDAAAWILSNLFLVFSFSIDFISPILQRHGGRYSRILKTLARRPVTALVFGLIMTAPLRIVSHLWERHPEWSWDVAVPVLFGVAIGSIAWSVVAGTWLGARLLPDFDRTSRSSPITRALTWAALLGVLGYNAYAFGAVGRSLYHKAQILKCDYDVDLGSFGWEEPSLLGMLASRRVEVSVHFDVAIRNPTEIDVAIEDNRLVVDHAGDHIATGKLAPVRVPAGATVVHRAELELEVSPLELRKGRALLEARQWTIILYLQVTDDLELPVYLLGQD